MHFDPALAAQTAFRQAEPELGPDWDEAVDLEDTFSSNASATARQAYEDLLALAARHAEARSFQAFCIFITWQQAAEETIARHFETGIRLCEAYFAEPPDQPDPHFESVAEIYRSFREGLGLEEEDDLGVEFRRDTPKGGD